MSQAGLLVTVNGTTVFQSSEMLHNVFSKHLQTSYGLATVPCARIQTVGPSIMTSYMRR